VEIVTFYVNAFHNDFYAKIFQKSNWIKLFLLHQHGKAMHSKKELV